MQLWLFQQSLLILTFLLFGIHGLKRLLGGTIVGDTVKKTLIAKLINIITRL
jgi:hypothetical protein